ncbi:hypothetical protein ANSO36C_03600 [Nostoc cf. commune SO-36]|uniref:Uncharacterized protein n=1 Tax=Nostoc cf. commune SO-36 TaxID=449208 RepID=A0ABN6PU56_NOSCO|nr:hypothetical protein [Nostoc commune]BDI14558.1 hypothetical protein ANSO36C_03600 [Nostoc cf. commune SO-36]
MTIPDQIKQFITWIQGFDHRILQNEDDIKEKFILPMFHYLYYPEKCHHEYSLTTNQSEKYGINYETAQIYFATDDLGKFDFEPSIIREGYRLVVVKPKVAIACNLPKALDEGNCEIEFSSILFRGLKINLNHQDILGQLMTGLHTQPDWGCRQFLKQLDKNTFTVKLGQTTVILSKLEVADLCLCVDKVCQEYKSLITEFENALETWDFELVKFSEIRGFILFSVREELWKLMQQFFKEFDYTKGKSEWHLFDRENISIRVSRGIRDHTFIFPKLHKDFSLFPDYQVDIIYELNNINLQSFEKGKSTLWQQDIGVRGTWTARYTKQWLLEKYIPKIINYYSKECQLSEAQLLAQITNYTSNRVLIKEIDTIIDLAPYLHDIQSWLHIYIENIAASLLQSYYQAYTDLVRNTDSSIIGIDYIIGNLCRIEWKSTPEEISNNSTDWKNLTFKYATHCLDEQVARINNCEYETSLNADIITRTFIWIIENGKISFSQAQLNAAKQALLPLWEQSRFEMRHVYPNR